MNPHGRKPPQLTPDVKTTQIYPLTKNPQMTARGQKPPKLTPLFKNPQNEPPRSKPSQNLPPRSKPPKFTPLTKNHPNAPRGQRPHSPAIRRESAFTYCMVCGYFLLLFARWQPTTWRGAVTALCFLQTSLLTLHHKSISYGHQKYRIHCVPIAY